MSTALEPQTDDLAQEVADIEKLDVGFERMRLRASFYDFVVEAWPHVEPSQPFVDNWHIRVICALLQEITLGNATHERYVFNIPPGTLKSLLISVLWPAWVWSRNAKKRFIVASYGASLSTRDNLRTRNLVMCSWYQRLFEVQLAEDQDTKTRYNTAEGGWRIATSIDGAGTGEHPNYFIIDDPLTAADAESAAARKTANDYLDRTVSTRGMTQKAILILVMQRLHKDDPSGHLIAQGDVEHVCFPMRYEPARPKTDEDPGHEPDPRDPRTEAGELLIPQLLDEVKVKKLERILGAYGTAGQLQQRPAPEGGGLFKRGWFKFMSARPKHVLRSARGWDTAATEKAGDYTCGVRVDEFEDGLFLLSNVQRDQLGPAGVDALMLSTARTDGRSVSVREEREGGASGKAVIEARAKALVGFDYKGVIVGTNKILRSKPFRSQCEAGNVYLLRTGDASQDAWIEPYLSELSQFPTGDNDDQVDGSSCSFNAVLLEPKVKKLKSASW